MLDKEIQKLTEALAEKLDDKEKGFIMRYTEMLQQTISLIEKQYRQYEEDGKLTFEIMSKYNRLSKLEKQLKRRLYRFSSEVRKDVYNVLKELYEEGYYRTAYLIETESKAKLAYSAIPAETIEKAILNPFTGLTLNERLERNRDNLIINMREEITRGLVEGDSYKTMTKRIQGALENDATKAMRIVRTESHRVMEESKYEAAQHAHNKGVETVKTWNSASDNRVRDRHKKLDGEQVATDKEFKLGRFKTKAPSKFGVASLDINCRCFLTYEIKKIKRKQYDVEPASFDKWQSERLAKQ